MVWRNIAWLAVGIFGVGAVVMLTTSTSTGVEPVKSYKAKVLKVYRHDPNAFCQGLIVDGSELFEGTGHYGRSTLRRVELETGAVLETKPLSAKYFGEGITLLGDRIYQITWREQVAIVYQRDGLKPLGAVRYTGEGWGLTDDEKHLFMSDGSATIRVVDPLTFEEIRRFTVMLGRKRIDQLNELEFVRGEIFANVWHSDQIARIDPLTGELLGWIDCSELYPKHLRRDREDVLNGIAYDAQANRLFVTGKNWPQLFEIEIVPAN